MSERSRDVRARLRELLRRGDPAASGEPMTPPEAARLRRAIHGAGERPGRAAVGLPRWGWVLAAAAAGLVLVVAGVEAARHLRQPVEPKVAALPTEPSAAAGSPAPFASADHGAPASGARVTGAGPPAAVQGGGAPAAVRGEGPPAVSRVASASGAAEGRPGSRRNPSAVSSDPVGNRSHAAGRHSPVAPSEPEGRQPVTIQFTTERGTRIVWVLDPAFHL